MSLADAVRLNAMAADVVRTLAFDVLLFSAAAHATSFIAPESPDSVVLNGPAEVDRCAIGYSYPNVRPRRYAPFTMPRLDRS